MQRTYGQYCGVVRALEMVGERWGLLIVRDLLVGPRRYTDLRNGLPKIPTNILAARLKEMEESGVIRRRILPRPASSVVYELTEYGLELESVMLELGRWGAQSLGELKDGEIVTLDSMIMALRTTFQQSSAVGLHLRYQFHFGPIEIHTVIDDGSIEVEAGPIDDPHAVFHIHGPVNLVMDGSITAEQALESGMLTLDGSAEDLDRFANLFRIGPKSLPAS
ncbi:MAG: helix-turn-helix domain-containing protein [Thermomicrobiales bacterium]